MRRVLVLLTILFLCTSLRAEPMKLGEVRSFMYLLQNVEDPRTLKALVESDYDMVVIEPTATVKDNEDFDIQSAVAQLHAGKKGRLVLAYLNPGQAESYRTYWKKEWKKPTKTSPGSPDFILKADPDGWEENYNVAFWDKRWQEVFATGEQSEVKRAMAAGFDGVYLDWVGAYEEDDVVAAAQKANVDPAEAMVDFLLLIRKTARETNPNAIVIQQNAVGLIDADARLKDAIDGLGVEDTWFGGSANAKWGSKGAGDKPNRYKGDASTTELIKQYGKYLAAGKPVFTIDYCVNSANAAKVYTAAHEHKLVALVTQVPLDHVTTTPPPKR